MNRPGPWIPVGIGGAVARAALLDCGIMEDPPGSNRGIEIDEYLRQVGCPPGNPWCAAAVAAWFRAAGAAHPQHLAASTNEWMKWAKGLGLWSSTPEIGAAIIYGKHDHAEHMGVIVRIAPELMSIEGNTRLEGPVREGFVVAPKFPSASWRLGYIRPRKLAPLLREAA